METVCSAFQLNLIGASHKPVAVCVLFSIHFGVTIAVFPVFEMIPVIFLCIDKSCVVGSRCVQLKTWFDYRNHVCIVSDL